MVIGTDPEDQLAPFDENLELERHVKATKKELIKNGKAEIKNYKNGLYKEFLDNPEKYAEECKNEAHLNYLKNKFPLKLKWTDEEIYQDEIKYEEPEDIGPDGEVYTTSNDDAKWDWYQLGGRWAGSLKLKKDVTPLQPLNFSWGWDDNEKRDASKKNLADVAYKKDIANLNELTTFALIKDGKWYEKGDMGWWGMVGNEKDEKEWDDEFKKLISDLPDDELISIYDCHI
jgi:hypothetical protein